MNQLEIKPRHNYSYILNGYVLKTFKKVKKLAMKMYVHTRIDPEL